MDKIKNKICQSCVMDSPDPDIVFYGTAEFSNYKDAKKNTDSKKRQDRVAWGCQQNQKCWQTSEI